MEHPKAPLARPCPESSVRLERGIRQEGDSLQAYVWVGGRQRSKRFPLDAPIGELRRWREDQRVLYRHGIPQEKAAGSFREDADTYLKLVRAMPSFDDRAYRIRQWVEAFGSRPRASITATEIRSVLEGWRQRGRFDGGQLSPASLNQRRTALMHLYTVLDGRSAANPVKDVPALPEEAGDQIRAQPIRVWYRLLARIGRRKWKTRRAKNRGTPQRLSKTRARLRVMLWTGLPHAQIMKLEPQDIDWTGPRIRVSRRRKGKGHAAKWLPILPPAVTALKAFARAEAWGPFSQSAMHSALARARSDENTWRRRFQRVPLPPIRSYDARHSFGTLIATLTTDERAIQDLMLHGTPRQTRRYTGGADEQRLQAAVAEITKRLT